MQLVCRPPAVCFFGGCAACFQAAGHVCLCVTVPWRAPTAPLALVYHSVFIWPHLSLPLTLSLPSCLIHFLPQQLPGLILSGSTSTAHGFTAGPLFIRCFLLPLQLRSSWVWLNICPKVLLVEMSITPQRNSADGGGASESEAGLSYRGWLNGTGGVRDVSGLAIHWSSWKCLSSDTWAPKWPLSENVLFLSSPREDSICFSEFSITDKSQNIVWLKPLLTKELIRLLWQYWGDFGEWYRQGARKSTPRPVSPLLSTFHLLHLPLSSVKPRAVVLLITIFIHI